MNILCSMQNKKIHVCRCISTRGPFDWAIEIFQTEPCYSPPQTRTDYVKYLKRTLGMK